jgi:predicted transcriptional regulator of viral defense system
VPGALLALCANFASPDRRAADMAAGQHGVVSVEQLHEAGLGPDKIKRRVRAGRLHRLHRGVYAVGHRGISQQGQWMAATLAVGGGAALSHRSAAALWDLLPSRRGDDIDVTTPGNGGRRQRAGIRLRRSSSLEARHLTRRRAIPVTTPARTLSDLQSSVSPQELRRAHRQAAVLGLSLGPEAEHDATRSALEAIFVRLSHGISFPPPRSTRQRPH